MRGWPCGHRSPSTRRAALPTTRATNDIPRANCWRPRARQADVAENLHTDRVATEHQLQKRLTHTWARAGVHVDGERHFLAAWEVMDDYRINSARLGFGRPAVDFLLLDAQGRVAVVELKMSVRTRRDSLAALCQVTRRAFLLAQAFTSCRLAGAYEECYSGRHGRVEPTLLAEDLWLAHARFFGCEPIGPTIPGRPFRRVVAAPEFGGGWEGARDVFASEQRELIDDAIGAYSQKGSAGSEFRHWRDLPTPPPGQVAPGISILVIDE